MKNKSEDLFGSNAVIQLPSQFSKDFMCNVMARSGVEQASPDFGFLKFFDLAIELADVDHECLRESSF